MIESQALDLSEFDTVNLSSIEGELNAAVDWVDDAFGDIDAEASRFAAVQVAVGFLKDLFSPR